MIRLCGYNIIFKLKNLYKYLIKKNYINFNIYLNLIINRLRYLFFK